MLSRIQIRQFLSVVDTGSFTRAASALYVAQPSLSAGIAELERQLGAQLFVRERRRIRLTEAGNQLLPIARAIEREFHHAEARISSLPIPSRPIRIGLLESLSSDWLASIFACYEGLEPLELIEGGERDLRVALTSGSVDFAVTLLHQGGTPFLNEVLYHEEYCVAVSSDHKLANAGQVDAHALAGEAMISRRSCEVLADTSRYFTERGVRPPFSLRSANDGRAMAMVSSGIGVTVAPRSLARPGVVMLKLAAFDRSRTIGLAFGPDWSKTHPNSHDILRCFREGATQFS